MHRSAMLWRCLSVCLWLLSAEPTHAADWRDALGEQVGRIERDTPGKLGVYVKRLDTGDTFRHAADQPWYLGSSAKVLIAVAVLQQVDAGKLKLTDSAVLQETDKIDGSGQLVWNQVGTRYSIDALLTRMLGVSDNTAANLLIRTVGDDTLNRSAAAALDHKDFKRLTNFTQVRRDVYAELHPDARKLTNRQLVEVAAAPLGPQRVEAVRRALGLQPADLKATTIDDAYARYYGTGVNTTTLVAYGGMLERLVRGQLLKPATTARLFTALKFGAPGSYRLEVGLPRTVKFMHKTGTQYRTACHMGVVNPQDGGAHAVVVATCAADMDEHHEAGKAFERVGRAVSETVLASPAPGR